MRKASRATSLQHLKAGARSAKASQIPADAVTITVQMRAREGQSAALEQELRALVVPTRREPGCIAYELHRSAERPGLFLLHEIWASREDHARHFETSHMKRWAQSKLGLLDSREASFWTRLA